MQKRYSSNLKSDIGILQILLDFGKPVLYRREIQGCGLNESFFDKEDVRVKNKVSRRIFGKRKNILLKEKFIRTLKAKDSRGNFFAITPLGIAFLVNHIGVNSFQTSKKISEIIGFHYKVFFERLYRDKDLSNIDFEIVKSIIEKMPKELKKTVKQNLMNVINGIKIFNDGKKISVYLTYFIPQNGPVIKQIFTITDNIIYHDYQGFSAVRQERDDEWFYGVLAHFISLAFNHHLVLQNFLFISDIAIVPPKRKKQLQTLYNISSKNEFFGFTSGMINNFETRGNALKSVAKLVKEIKIF